MPDPTTQPDDELEDQDATDDGASDDESSPPEVTPEAFAALQAQIAELRATSVRATRDAAAAIGRYQSLAARLDAKPEDSALLKQLQAQGDAVTAALNAVIEDDTVDPKVQAKAREALAKIPDPEKEDLRARLAALEKARAIPTVQPATTDFEREIEDEITGYGLNPDDPAFDWKGEASSLLTTQGPAAVRTYFRAKIKTLLDEQRTAGRRQQRKEAGKTDTKTVPAGNNANPLDLSRPTEERLKWLQDQGII